MANGPFQSYAPPGVYTETRANRSLSGPPTGLQIPIFLGTGRETLSQVDFELVRGSSSTVDQLIQEEDVSQRFVVDNTNPDNPILGAMDGLASSFKVQNFPIVIGDGQGLTTNRPQDVDVTVDGIPVVVAQVDGANGIVSLQVPPPENSVVEVTYFFNRKDTFRQDDLSGQVTDAPSVLKASVAGSYVIVAGTNNVLSLDVNGTAVDIELTAGTRTAADVAVDINSSLVLGLTASADTDNQGNSRLQLSADGDLVILDGSANSLFGFANGDSDPRNRTFVTYEGPIVDGTNGGITTTNVNDVSVLVDGEAVTVESMDGANRSVVLAEAPLVGSTVVVEYYFNSFQNTFDFLPNKGITSVTRVGNAPGRNDYVQGLDYLVVDDRILWGSAVTVEPGLTTPGSEPLDDSEISTTLADDKMYLEGVARLQDRTVSPPRPSNQIVVLGNVPTAGDGRDTPTSDVSLVEIYHGPDLLSAVQAGKREVVKVDPTTREVTVKDAIPAGDLVFATYYYNRLRDDTYTVTRTNSGRIRVASSTDGTGQFNVRFGTTAATDTIQWPSGVESNPDAIVVGTDGVNETVTVTFNTVDGGAASFTNALQGPYDIFAGTSDQFGTILNDGGRGVTNDVVTVDLDQAAFAVLVSDSMAVGTTYTITTGTNDTFTFSHDGTNYTADLNLAAGTTIKDVAEVIWRAVESTAKIDGTNQDLANGGADFVLAGTTTYSIEINGTTYTQADTALVGGTYDAAAAAAAIQTALATASGLTPGDLSDPTNDFQVVANADGTVSILASESLTVNTTANGGDELDTLMGFAPLDTQQENVKIARTWEGTDAEYLLLRSRTTPTVPSDVSSIQVLNGNANDTLGFVSFAEATGTLSATNKGATLLSDGISATMITNLEASEPDFIVSIDGIEYTVPGADFDTVASVGDIVTAIDGIIGAAGANVAAVTVEDTDKIRILSNTVDANSTVEIGTGAANQYLGFDSGELAGQRRPSAAEVVAVLNNDTLAWADNSAGSVDLASAPTTAATTGEFLNVVYAEALEQTGVGTFVQISSFNTGVDTSITFDDVANSAFNDTGMGIEDGDSASGTDGTDGFTVTSSAGAGSAGTGFVGQTYTDAVTGLRFTILAAEDGDYSNGETFTLIVEDEMMVGTSVVNRAMNGVQATVSLLTDVAVNDTALVKTYDKGGDEPSIGDFYYISYDYTKEDFDTLFFTRFREVQENYGDLSPENPLTMAAYLALLNGAAIVAAKQVQKAPGSQQATSASYIAAVDELRKPLQNGIRPDIIVPLTTDTSVYAAIVKHCEIQSSPRYRNECRAIFGVASGTRPTDASQIAQGLNSERALVLYPDSALLTLTDEIGQETTLIVDGSFLAAALAGLIVSPANDVATPLTRRRLVGFDRLNRSLDEIEMNQLATSGVTVLQDRTPFIEVRHGLTTNVSNVLTQTPSVIAIKDFVQQQTRATLERFIGLKFITSRAQDVELALTGLLNTLVENQIITAFRGVSAEPDPNDPTMLRVEAFYSPIFPLLFIPVTFTISSSTST